MMNHFDNIKEGQPVIVYWLDALTDTGWAEDGKVVEEDCLMQTIGFFHSVSPAMVRLYGTMGTYTKGENDRFLIPLGCVVKVCKYPRPRKPKLNKT